MKELFSFFEKPGERPVASVAAVIAHLRALGFELSLGELPARCAPLDAAAIRAMSHGRVTKPETINYRTFKPEPDGLFCQKIFGPVADYECACGTYKRMKHRGTVCETCGVEVIASGVRAERLGHIDLAAPVPHPLLDGETLEAIAVLPPELRPIIPLSGGGFATSDLNDLYRRVINRNNRLARLMELDAPQLITDKEKSQLEVVVRQLFDNERSDKPVTGPQRRPLKSLCASLSSLAARTITKSVDFSGVAPLVADDSIGPARCRLPRVLARELFRPWTYGELERSGQVATIKSAKQLVERDAPEARAALERACLDTPALLMMGDRLVSRGIQLWDHPAVGVTPATAATLGPGLVAIHIPVTEAGRAECHALPDCPEPRPYEPGGWLTRLIGGADPRECLREAAAGGADQLSDLAVRAVFAPELNRPGDREPDR